MDLLTSLLLLSFNEFLMDPLLDPASESLSFWLVLLSYDWLISKILPLLLLSELSLKLSDPSLSVSSSSNKNTSSLSPVE